MPHHDRWVQCLHNRIGLLHFQCELSTTQQKYSVTELEHLAIVETLNEFTGMLWWQQMKVYMDH